MDGRVRKQRREVEGERERQRLLLAVLEGGQRETGAKDKRE